LGIDGPWVDKVLLQKNISLQNFLETDLERDFKIERKFDLALCLEVVEHLEEKAADNIIKNITGLSDLIIFSASIPGQMGQNHLNEQYPYYWQQKFMLYNFEMLDILRPLFWEESALARWYKQNIFLVKRIGTRLDLNNLKQFSDGVMLSFIHPEYYEIRVNQVINLNNEIQKLNEEISFIKTGNASFSLYLKMVVKKLMTIFRIKKYECRQ
jgi:hypothetical protein